MIIDGVLVGGALNILPNGLTYILIVSAGNILTVGVVTSIVVRVFHLIDKTQKNITATKTDSRNKCRFIFAFSI